MTIRTLPHMTIRTFPQPDISFGQSLLLKLFTRTFVPLQLFSPKILSPNNSLQDIFKDIPLLTVFPNEHFLALHDNFSPPNLRPNQQLTSTAYGLLVRSEAKRRGGQED